MRIFVILASAAVLAFAPINPAPGQPAGAGNLKIVWEVKNRFRLFRKEADFIRQVSANKGDGVLAAERRLARESDGYGWAKDVVASLCVDTAGKLIETCERDGERESYLAPRDHRVRHHGVRRHAAGRELRVDTRRRRGAAADQGAM